MKKLKSTWYNMAIVLTVIALVAGFALAYVNSITKEPIEKIQLANEMAAISNVLKSEKVVITDTIVCPATDKDNCKDSIYVYVADNGFAVKTLDPQNASFGGGLSVMVGFNKEGQIMGYTVLETKETPGLGAKAGDWFQEGQKGCIIGMNPGEKPLEVKKDNGEVDAITASTITSRAFLRAVNAAHSAAFASNESDTNK